MTKDDTITELKKELNFLYRVAKNVHSLELTELLAEIVDIATAVTHGDSCLIYVLDSPKKALILKASKNPHKILLEKISMQLGEGITGWVAREKKPVAIAKGASRDGRFKFFRSLPEDRFEAFLSVPIINKKGLVGVINIQHKLAHKHSKMEVNLLTAIGKLVGGAVENALLIAQTMELRDALELRKVIEKAKGILMQKKSISENEAYTTLQKESMNLRKSLKEVAEAVIIADECI